MVRRSRLAAFGSAFTAIYHWLRELGEKTFFVAMCGGPPPRAAVVFNGAFSARPRHADFACALGYGLRETAAAGPGPWLAATVVRGRSAQNFSWSMPRRLERGGPLSRKPREAEELVNRAEDRQIGLAAGQ